MYNYLKHFPLMGYIKLAFGILFIVMGIKESQVYIVIMGGLLMLLTFLNKGTCAENNCSVPNRSQKRRR
ncbi:hypothetical protein [Myroides indicus]|uniref:DoxX-like protein n=1 Tax=Myroides indicus TaxID=1323422 RepID=A0A4R7FEM7_9FLAO|nr:hypothetical protein [Myroides indicus]TDS66196.1 hypothetical protein C8P70_10192 [Myroides indicus]